MRYHLSLKAKSQKYTEEEGKDPYTSLHLTVFSDLSRVKQKVT